MRHCRLFLTLVLPLLLALILPPPARSEPVRTVKVAAFSLFPAIFLDTDGQTKGFYVEMLDAIAAQEGWRVEYVHGSWADGLQRIKAGEVDLLTSVAWTADRASYMDFTRTPLLTVWGELYVPGDSGLDNIRQFDGKTIAVMKGDRNGAMFQEMVTKFGLHCTYVEMADFDAIFHAIEGKRVDGGVVNNTYGTARQSDFRVKSSGVIFNPFDIYFTVAKGENREILTTLDRYLDKWRSEEKSVYHEARQRWAHGTASAVQIIPRWVKTTSIALALCALGGFLLSIILRVKVRQATAELRQREVGLAESQARYQALFDNSPVALREADFSQVKRYLADLPLPEGGELAGYILEHPEIIRECYARVATLDYNRAALQLYEADSKEALAGNLPRTISSNSLHSRAVLLAEICRGGTFLELEGELATLRGQLRQVLVRWQVMPGHEGDYGRTLTAYTDVTRNHETGEALRLLAEGTAISDLSHSFFETLVGSFARLLRVKLALLGLLDTSGKQIESVAVCLDGNTIPNFCYELSGSPCEQVIERGEFCLFAEQVAELFPNDRLLRDLGAVSYLGLPLKDSEGRILGLLVGVHDQPLTTSVDAERILRIFGSRGAAELERLQADRRLRLAKEAAEAAARAKASFLANMSHEIRTPLNGVLGVFELLELAPTAAEQREYLAIGRQSGAVLLQLIDDILNLARIEEGHIDLRLTPIDIRALSTDIRNSFNHGAQQKGLTLSAEFADNLPERVLGDDYRLRQILLNLVGNALKFTERGSIALRWTVEPSALPGHVILHLAVSDSGCGIAPEILPRIFEPFTQGDDSYRKSYQGAGLGLSIVKRLVEALGGTLAVESAVNVGTTFRVNLPVQVVMDEATAQVQRKDPPVPAVEKQSLRILLAEDNEANLILFRTMLERFGHSVRTARDGREALQILEQEAFDLAMFDVQMPVLDGIEATQLIRADSSGRYDRTLPIIAITAYSMAGDRERFLAAGMSDYLSKPIRREVLEQVLAGYRPRQRANS